jgi:hypothetical protein
MSRDASSILPAMLTPPKTLSTIGYVECHRPSFLSSDFIQNKVGIDIADTADGALPNFEISNVLNATCDSVTNTGNYRLVFVKH